MAFQQEIRQPVVAYCRISKDRDGNELGVKRQRSKIEELEERLGVQAGKWYIDNDISAFAVKARRPDFEQLMADCRSGLVGTVLTYHNDRLIRQPRELEAWIDSAPGTSVYSALSGEYDLSTPDGRALARILGAIAAKDSEHQSKRIRDQKEERAKKGLKVGGGRPFGYTADGMHLEPREASFLGKAAHDVLAGKPIREIAREWTRAGLVGSRSKKPFAPSTIAEMLKRPRIAGIMVFRGHIYGEAGWPGIIDKETYTAVYQLLSDPARKTHRGTVPTWLGSGVYHCGVCGNGVRCTRNNGRNRPAYQCRSRLGATDSGRTGQHVQRLADPVDELVVSAIVGYLSDGQTRDALATFHNDGEGVELGPLREELAQIEAKQLGLAELLADPNWTTAMVSKAGAAMAVRRAEIESTLVSVATKSTALRVASADNVGDAWESSDLDTKKLIINELAVVTIMPSKLRGLGPGGKPYAFDPRLIDVAWVA